MLGHMEALLQSLQIPAFGICSFDDCLPLRPCRAVSRVPSGARSVIVCLFPYYIGAFAQRNVARYALSSDYHRVAGEFLAAVCAGLQEHVPDASFVPFVDNSPIWEVAAAQRAGLGVVGRNGQLISAAWGCHTFLGSIVTTLALPASQPETGHCLDCGACVAACPTGALSPDGAFERERCRSHITQKKGSLTAWEQEQIRAGGFVWGCDLCTDACSMNTRKITPIAALHQNPVPLLSTEQLDVLLDEKAYGYRGKAVLQRNLRLLTRSC